jgi:glyoxylase-like metal-dependent hydrolase (beta-lactamase superfamily II)
MTTDASFDVLDVNFLGRPGVVSCGLIRGAGGVALVDPGPSSSLSGLRAALAAHGLALGDVNAILVTHIHLDHSGAIGSIAREHGAVQVFVHERGAPHMVDPSRLLKSAARIYGDAMDRLWGEVAPVPASRVHPLKGGERLAVVGREIEVAYTPGHAVHHVSYFDTRSQLACVGDVGGMCAGPTRLVVPPTPPPDIDLEMWEASIARIRQWQPARLFIAHFGVVDAPGPHLDELLARLGRLAARVRESLLQDGRDRDRVAWFTRTVAADLRTVLSEADAAQIEREVMLEDSWHGLARYWRRRLAEENASRNADVS